MLICCLGGWGGRFNLPCSCAKVTGLGKRFRWSTEMAAFAPWNITLPTFTTRCRVALHVEHAQRASLDGAFWFFTLGINEFDDTSDSHPEWPSWSQRNRDGGHIRNVIQLAALQKYRQGQNNCHCDAMRRDRVHAPHHGAQQEQLLE